MDRRKFLKWLGVAAPAAAASTITPKVEVVESPTMADFRKAEIHAIETGRARMRRRYRREDKARQKTGPEKCPECTYSLHDCRCLELEDYE